MADKPDTEFDQATACPEGFIVCIGMGLEVRHQQELMCGGKRILFPVDLASRDITAACEMFDLGNVQFIALLRFTSPHEPLPLQINKVRGSSSARAVLILSNKHVVTNCAHQRPQDRFEMP